MTTGSARSMSRIDPHEAEESPKTRSVRTPANSSPTRTSETAIPSPLAQPASWPVYAIGESIEWESAWEGHPSPLIRIELSLVEAGTPDQRSVGSGAHHAGAIRGGRLAVGSAA
jgi:hypothetical protein